MIKTYQKKPVKVEAVQWDGENKEEVLSFCNTDGHLRAVATGITKIIVIRTLEGNMEARVGDYIIKGVKGEFYPCKPNIFRETYEEVSEQEVFGDTIRYPMAGVVDKPEILHDPKKTEEKCKDGELTNGTETETDNDGDCK